MSREPWSDRRVLAARIVAVVADGLQILVFPLFFEGFLSPLDIALDLIVFVIMMVLLGWNVLFLPTFVAEGIPFADLAPTWTAAVFWVTRKGNREIPIATVAPAPELPSAPQDQQGVERRHDDP